MKNLIGRITEHDLVMANRIADRSNKTPAQVLRDFNAFLNEVEKFENDEEECE
jgi:hypothetical protein